MVSEPGDYIGQGGTYPFALPPRTINLTSSGNHIGFQIVQDGTTPELTPWTFDFVAPPGERLAPGTYSSVVPGNGPAVVVGGDGRGCGGATGSFTVTRVEFGLDDRLVAFDATFQQMCGGSTGVLRGQVSLLADALSVTVDPLSVISRGAVVVTGSVGCTSAVSIPLSGTVTQERSAKPPLVAVFNVDVACVPDTTVRWTARAKPASGSFRPGPAVASAIAAVFDFIPDVDDVTLTISR